MWERFTTDRVILDIVSGYQLPFIETPQPNMVPKEKFISSNESEIMKKSIEELISKGAIEMVENDQNDHYLSPIFLVPKPDGSLRFILKHFYTLSSFSIRGL